MRFNITKVINILAGAIIFLSPMTCLSVTLGLLTLAYFLLKLTERLGRRYILIGKKRPRKAIKF